MHPAGSLPLMKEDKEEEEGGEEDEDQPEPVYIQMDPDEYIKPPSTYYASKELLGKGPDLKAKVRGYRVVD